MIKVIEVWWDEYDESLDRLYMDEYDNIREEKVIKFS
jgi:hypothetical protein